MKEKLSPKSQGRLELAFSIFSEEDVAVSVRTAIGSGPLQPRNIGARSKKAFRALCILVLLATDRGESSTDKKRLIFDSATDEQTWINTLATQRKRTIKFLLDDLGLKKFWQGRKKSGELQPRVKFLPRKLPLQNIKLFPHPPRKENTELSKTEIRKLAQLLEQKLLDEDLPEKERWEVSIVTQCLRATDELNGIVLPPQYDVKAVPLPLKKQSLEEIQNQLLYHLRRDHGEKESLSLLTRYNSQYSNLCNAILSSIWGDSPLLTAMTFGKRKVVDWLLKQPQTDVNKASSRGITPILKAARLNDLILIDRLLARGADPKVNTLQGRNAIHEAAFGGSPVCLQTIKLFANLGIDCNVFDRRGSLPLFLVIGRSASNDAYDWLKEQLDAHTVSDPHNVYKPRAESARENRGLFHWVGRGETQLVQDLLNYASTPGAPPLDINAEHPDFGSTPLHMALVPLRYEMIRLLLRFGANPLRQDICGTLPRELLPPLRTTDRERKVDSTLSRAEQKWIEAEYKGSN